MVYLLPAVFALGSFGLMLGLTMWAFRSKKRGGTWKLPAVAALVLAFVVAWAVVILAISIVGTVASADAASRATMLARVISETMNATCFVCMIACPLLLVFAGYRLYVTRKAKKPRDSEHPHALLTGENEFPGCASNHLDASCRPFDPLRARLEYPVDRPRECSAAACSACA